MSYCTTRSLSISYRLLPSLSESAHVHGSRKNIPSAAHQQACQHLRVGAALPLGHSPFDYKKRPRDVHTPVSTGALSKKGC